MKPRRPLVRYFGGKWKIADWVISHFPPHASYAEPFGGAASVLLRKPPVKLEIYNDLDDELVNLFRVLRSEPEELRRQISLTPYSRAEFHASYEPADDPMEQARRTVTRLQMGYSSSAHNTAHRTGFRTHAGGNLRSAAVEFAAWPDNVVAVIERLRHVVIEHRDAVDLIQAHDRPEMLFYVDPPYVHSERSRWNKSDLHCGKSAYRHELDQAGQERLAETLNSVAGAVVLSGYKSKLYSELYAGWTCVTRQARAQGRFPRTECLWLNPRAQPCLNF